MLIVGVDPPELPLLLLLLLVFALPPPLLLLELFELDPQAATTNAVIATISSTANGRTCLLKAESSSKRSVSQSGEAYSSARPVTT
jgi:hypothetical protein